MKFHTRALALVALSVALLVGLASSSMATPIPIGPDGFTPPPIRVAVVYSQTTLDWLNVRGTPSRYPHGGKEKALLYYLQQRGYNVTQIVGDRDLVNSDTLIQNYDVIVLNSMYGMGYPASESLARFVAAGGGLVATIGSPRVNPAYRPKKGKDHLNEWWWRVMNEHGGLHYWEWGPLSSLYHEAFVNDGSYTPEYTLKPNPNSPIIRQTQAILDARGYNDDISGVTLHHPGANLEMSLKLTGATDCTSAADFNLLTKSVKKLYPKTYTAILGSLYGAGRAVKFDYGATDYLQNYNGKLYSPNTPTGIHQGEVAGALIEASIIWAASGDGSVAHSVDATTYATVSARGSSVTARQYVTNNGTAMTRGNVRFAIRSASGKTLKSWITTNVTFMPHQSRSYSYTYGHALPAGACKVVASFDGGYPSAKTTATTESAIVRGQSVRTY